MGQIKEFLLDLLFPKKCVSCGKWGEFVCANCYKEIIFKENQECPRCNAITKKGKYCPRCKNYGEASGIISVGYYKDKILKELLHLFKYQGIFAITELLSDWMSQKITKEKIKFDVVTFVPLSKKRQTQRGYNQSELLAKEIASKFQKPLTKSLRKTKETKTQVGLPKKERLKNLSGAFILIKDAEIAGKRILLVDDVLTTGSTINECAKILRNAGAREIWGITVAKE